MISSRRCLASTSDTSTNLANQIDTTEIGPSAPELQLNNLTGDHQSNACLIVIISLSTTINFIDVLEIALNRPERRNALGKQLLHQVNYFDDELTTIDSI
jgi:hypothetical protein